MQTFLSNYKIHTHTHTLLLFSAGEGTMTMKYILKMDTEDISWPKFLKSN